jgi:hypothetical protein
MLTGGGRPLPGPCNKPPSHLTQPRSIRLFSLIGAVAFLAPIAGCSPEMPESILGVWTVQEETPAGPWSLTYTFGEKRYSVSGEPPTKESGLVQVDDQDCRRYHLVFTQRVANGQLAPDLNVWVELSRDESRMTWEDHVYSRVKID